MDNEDVELTEMHDLKVKRQDGVKAPANGFRFLVMKSTGVENAEGSMDSGSGCGCCEACGSDSDECSCSNCMVSHERSERAAGAAVKDVNAVGGIDETPDINKAEFVIRLLAQLIEAEAREAAVGAHEEADIATLTECMSLMKWFLHQEQYEAQEDDGNFMKEVAEEFLVCKAHRKFSSDERKSLASEGKALPDGSYPIPDADALHRAAILARSGHGDVAAAKRLIAKRARELKVPNPLNDNDDAQKDAPEVVESVETETPEVEKSAEDVETFTRDDVSEMIAKALAETVEAVTKERDAARDELTVLKATPIPGGPSIMAVNAAKDVKEQSANVEKALYHERLAQSVQDRELMKYHRAEAQRLRKLAA